MRKGTRERERARGKGRTIEREKLRGERGEDRWTHGKKYRQSERKSDKSGNNKKGINQMICIDIRSRV